MEKIIECVPNVSEGRNKGVIEDLGRVIKKVEGVSLLHIDSNADANRTVYTFAGEPVNVIEAAVELYKQALEKIDMSAHTGTHPRFGAVDVCPFVPIRGVTIEEADIYAKELAEQIGGLGIPVYLYEYSALSPERASLAYLRKGEYEGLRERVGVPEWMPDKGPDIFHSTFGATAIGARKILVAFNISLDTKDISIANQIAGAIRESGVKGKKGVFKKVRAIGWYMEEYGCVQVSINFLDIDVSPVHLVFEEVMHQAAIRGVTVSGSELIGLMPEKVLTEAARYYQSKFYMKGEINAESIAIKRWNLSMHKAFIRGERIIETMLSRLPSSGASPF